MFELLHNLSARGWPTGMDLESIQEEDERAEAGCSLCGVAYAPHERGEHQFCGRHLHLIETPQETARLDALAGYRRIQ